MNRKIYACCERCAGTGICQPCRGSGRSGFFLTLPKESKARPLRQQAQRRLLLQLPVVPYSRGDAGRRLGRVREPEEPPSGPAHLRTHGLPAVRMGHER